MGRYLISGMLQRARIQVLGTAVDKRLFLHEDPDNVPAGGMELFEGQRRKCR